MSYQNLPGRGRPTAWSEVASEPRDQCRGPTSRWPADRHLHLSVTHLERREGQRLTVGRVKSYRGEGGRELAAAAPEKRLRLRNGMAQCARERESGRWGWEGVRPWSVCVCVWRGPSRFMVQARRPAMHVISTGPHRSNKSQ